VRVNSFVTRAGLVARKHRQKCLVPSQESVCAEPRDRNAV
jgi:hypothetical protein